MSNTFVIIYILVFSNTILIFLLSFVILCKKNSYLIRVRGIVVGKVMGLMAGQNLVIAKDVKY